MVQRTRLAFFQAGLIIICAFGAWQISDNLSTGEGAGSFSIIDSNEKVHHFDEEPSRVAITNTYAASVMKMLGIDMNVVVGVSGDFSLSPSSSPCRDLSNELGLSSGS